MDALTITLEDGRVFPVYNDDILSWDIGSSFHHLDESEGAPRTRAIIRAFRQHRPEQLKQEHQSYLKHSFNRMFGHSARKLLDLIEDECPELSSPKRQK